MARLRAIGCLAHLPIYVAAGWVVTPSQPAAYVALGCVSVVLAYFWPVVDYVAVAAVASVSLIAAAFVVAASVGAAYLAAAVLEAIE